MKLEVDRPKFDELQPWFVGELIEDTKRHLEESGIRGDQLKELCETLVFSTCTLLDGSQSFEVDGKKFVPYVSFSDSEETMFYPGSTSYFHEYLHGVLDEVFEES